MYICPNISPRISAPQPWLYRSFINSWCPYLTPDLFNKEDLGVRTFIFLSFLVILMCRQHWEPLAWRLESTHEYKGVKNQPEQTTPVPVINAWSLDRPSVRTEYWPRRLDLMVVLLNSFLKAVWTVVRAFLCFSLGVFHGLLYACFEIPDLESWNCYFEKYSWFQ